MNDRTLIVAALAETNLGGLTKETAIALMDKINVGDGEYLPLEIDANYVESSATGFIALSVADEMDYRHHELIAGTLAAVMDDMDLETDDCIYPIEVDGRTYNVWLGRDP